RRAALWGAAAALCRPLGALLAPSYALAAWRAAHPSGTEERAAAGTVRAGAWTYAGAAAPLAGLALYMGYLAWKVGRPLAFSEAQRTWHRAWAWPWTALIEGVRRPLHHLPALTMTDWHALGDFALTIVLLAVSLACWRWLRREQALYLGLFWLLTLSS